MLNPVIFLSENFNLFHYDGGGDPANPVYPSLLLDAADTEKMGQAYKFVSENQTNNFSLAFYLHEALSEKAVLTICSFLFIPFYLDFNGQRPLLLLAKDGAVLELARTKITAAAESQGVNNLLIHCGTSHEANSCLSPVAGTTEGFIFYTTATLVINYEKALENGQVNQLFYLFDVQADQNELPAVIAAIESRMKATNPVVYRLANELAARLRANQLLSKKYTAVENELNNYRSHMEIMRSGHEAAALQQYYDNEYEALPLWYKRCGHMIKVLTGKRSFRSLFNHQIKKQKD